MPSRETMLQQAMKTQGTASGQHRCVPTLPAHARVSAGTGGTDHSTRGHHPHPWVTEGLILETTAVGSRGSPVWERAGKDTPCRQQFVEMF